MLTPYWITTEEKKDNRFKTLNNCRFCISPMPDGFGGLEEDINRVKQKEGVNIIVSALTKADMNNFGLQDEALVCKKLGIDYYNLPIRDCTIPGVSKFYDFIEQDLFPLSYEENTILIHCRAGIGRSGLIALGLAIRHGYSYNYCLQHGRKIRGINVPQAESQYKLLKMYETHVQTNYNPPSPQTTL